MRHASPRDIASIALHLTRHRLAARSTIFWQGQQSDAVFLVCEGSVKLVSYDELGTERIARFVWPGEFFGLDSVLQQIERPFGAITREPSQIARIEFDYFRRLIVSDPSFFCNVLDYVCRIFVSTTVEKIDISGDRIRRRLQRVLADLQRTTKLRQTVSKANPCDVTQHELAQLLGVAEETISRELKKLHQKKPLREQVTQPKVISSGKSQH
jgi:CRP-like cAMP-binding protein